MKISVSMIDEMILGKYQCETTDKESDKPIMNLDINGPISLLEIYRKPKVCIPLKILRVVRVSQRLL